MGEERAATSATTEGAGPRVEVVPVGALAANCYLLMCRETHEAAVIDPGAEAGRVLDLVRAQSARVTRVIHTHGHFDHISGTEELLAGLPGPVAVAAHSNDLYLYAREMRAAGAPYGYALPDEIGVPDEDLVDGQELAIGTLRVRVVHTPGHTPGGVSLVVAPWCLFSGDTLFRRGVGRTDLRGGDEDALYTSIETRLYPLDSELVVYPGHGPPTTIGEERRMNPFVKG